MSVDKVRLGVDIGNIEISDINPHLYPCISFLSDRKEKICLFYWNDDRGVVNSIKQEFPDLNCEKLDSEYFPDHIQVFFPSSQTKSSMIEKAFLAGVKVFQILSKYEDSDFLDLIQGYINNIDSDWFAKVFPEPVHVADWCKLDLGLGCTINPRAILLNAGLDGNGGLVRLGRASHIGADALLNLGPTDFTVGKFSMISANFAAHAMRHSLSHISNFAIKKGRFSFLGEINDKASAITIGNDVWIGEGVKCLPGVDIPNGCVVGAGSIVTSILEPYGIYAGNPARYIRSRFSSKKIEVLEGIAWWDMDFEYLKEIKNNFKKDITNMNEEELKELF